jgi:hypothetical protein
MAKQEPEVKITDISAVEEGTERPKGKPFRAEAIDENGNVVGWAFVESKSAGRKWWEEFKAGKYAKVDPADEIGRGSASAEAAS